MCENLIFGGTTEGRELTEFCTKNNIHAFISVATDYGEYVLENSDFITVLKGRMTSENMTDFITQNNIKTVIDATHPYAVEVTQNIKSACQTTNTAYIRLKRHVSENTAYGKYFDHIHSVIDYLNTKDGNIFITTGSKEVHLFRQIKNYHQRCIIRVLPSETIVSQCRKLGFKTIIAQEPPFSYEDNVTLIKKYHAKFLVTKESGTNGGFDIKLQSAQKCNIEFLVIKRPEEEGFDFEYVKKFLSEKNNG